MTFYLGIYFSNAHNSEFVQDKDLKNITKVSNSNANSDFKTITVPEEVIKSIEPIYTRESFYSRLSLAFLATTVATIFEVPLDRAKMSMASGNKKLLLFSSLIRIPLGVGLLLSFDQLRCNTLGLDKTDKII